MDREKVIDRLRQEIRILNKAIEDMQVVSVMMPRKLLSRVHLYLLGYARDTGEILTLSDLICDAVEVYLWGEEENRRVEA